MVQDGYRNEHLALYILLLVTLYHLIVRLKFSKSALAY